MNIPVLLDASECESFGFVNTGLECRKRSVCGISGGSDLEGLGLKKRFRLAMVYCTSIT